MYSKKNPHFYFKDFSIQKNFLKTLNYEFAFIPNQ